MTTHTTKLALLLLGLGSAPGAAQRPAMPQVTLRGGWTHVGALAGGEAGLDLLWPAGARRLQWGFSLDRTRADFGQPRTEFVFQGAGPGGLSNISASATCSSCRTSYVQQATVATADLRYDLGLGRVRPFLLAGAGYAMAAERIEDNYSCALQADGATAVAQCVPGVAPPGSGAWYFPGSTTTSTRRELALLGGAGVDLAVTASFALTAEFRLEQRPGGPTAQLGFADGTTGFPRASSLLIGVTVW